jgi:C4-dicarboxylate transporter DctM subunit
VAVILMAAPILMPIILSAGFDPYWFAVVLTINMEIGLISPPVGLNLYVINGIAPDIKLKSCHMASRCCYGSGGGLTILPWQMSR